MDEVCRARDTRLGHEVALKLLPAEMSANPDRRKRFARQAQAIAALKHPNIVTIYVVEESDGEQFSPWNSSKAKPSPRAFLRAA